MKASPDGKRIYVGGSFTSASGTTKWNLAAFDATTGALITTFKAAVGGSYVNALAITDNTVYVGGLLGAGNGVTRKNLMAFNTSGSAARLGSDHRPPGRLDGARPDSRPTSSSPAGSAR